MCKIVQITVYKILSFCGYTLLSLLLVTLVINRNSFANISPFAIGAVTGANSSISDDNRQLASKRRNNLANPKKMANNYPINYNTSPEGYGEPIKRVNNISLESFSEPNPVTTDSRIKTLIYNKSEVFKLKFHYGYQSYIEFSKGEEIELISIGESYSWKLTPIGRRLFIRPLDLASHTNMTIITNKTNYEFDLRSGEYDGKSDEELVYIVRFYHPPVFKGSRIPPRPGASKPAPIRLPKKASPRMVTPPAQVNLSLPEEISGRKKGEVLNFDYSMSGDYKNIKPLRIYDNGKETFFKFKNNNFIVPDISVVDMFGNEIKVRKKIKNGYVVIPKIAKQFSLRMNHELICVFSSTSAPQANPKIR